MGTDEASPELGGLDRDIPESFLQVPVLGPDRVDGSGRHNYSTASPRRVRVESVGGRRREQGWLDRPVVWRDEIQTSTRKCISLRALCYRQREKAAAGGADFVFPHY